MFLVTLGSVHLVMVEYRLERGGRKRREGSLLSSEADVGEKIYCCTIQAAFVLFRVTAIRFTAPDEQIDPLKDIIGAQV